jgi:RNA polymerase sigma factor (TIGR02999 family)
VLGHLSLEKRSDFALERGVFTGTGPDMRGPLLRWKGPRLVIEGFELTPAWRGHRLSPGFVDSGVIRASVVDEDDGSRDQSGRVAVGGPLLSISNNDDSAVMRWRVILMREGSLCVGYQVFGLRRRLAAHRLCSLLRVECSMATPASVTKLLHAWRQGDEGALARLTPLVHQELQRIARRCMRGERTGHSVQATALVNEAYLRLVGVQRVNWQNRAHFLAMSARLMRRILVELARARTREKRGGGAVRVSLADGLLISERGHDLVALDDALEALARLEPRKSQVVELRFFGGLSVEEVSEALGISPETVMRDWKFSKAWLMNELHAPSAR